MEWRFGVALWFGGVLTVFPSKLVTRLGLQCVHYHHEQVMF